MYYQVIRHLWSFSLPDDEPATGDLKETTEVSPLELAAANIILAPVDMEVASAVEVSDPLQKFSENKHDQHQESDVLGKEKVLEVPLPEEENDHFDPPNLCLNNTLEKGEMNEHEGGSVGIKCKQPAEGGQKQEKQTSLDDRRKKKRRENCRSDYR